jgi:hypothetical protein
MPSASARYGYRSSSDPKVVTTIRRGRSVPLCLPVKAVRPFWLAEPELDASSSPAPFASLPGPQVRAQPLQFEALNGRNARKSTITGMSTAAFDPTGEVPQPAPFPIAKTVLPNPIADPGTGRRKPRRVWAMPPGQTLAPGYGQPVLDGCFHGATWQRARSGTTAGDWAKTKPKNSEPPRAW